MRPIKCCPVVLPGTARPAGREKGESIKEREYEKPSSWVDRVQCSRAPSFETLKKQALGLFDYRIF